MIEAQTPWILLPLPLVRCGLQMSLKRLCLRQSQREGLLDLMSCFVQILLDLMRWLIESILTRLLMELELELDLDLSLMSWLRELALGLMYWV